MARRAFGSFSIVALLICAALLGTAAPAAAAIVANGDFETGTLEGWTTTSLNGHEEWFAYDTPGAGGGLAAPPSGSFAAGTRVGSTRAGTTFLFQDLALPASTTDELSLYLYYDSAEPIAVPSPDTLFASEAVEATVQANQQVRVDVLKPNSPNESLSPNDILTTVYASKAGDPQELAPTLVTANLSAFAGQTVRLRIAAVAQEGPLAVGVDAVAVASNPLPQPTLPSTALPSNEFTKGKLTLNKRSGTGVLAVNLPGAGSLTASDARRALAIASAARRKDKPKAKPILIRTRTIQVTTGGVVKVPILPTPAGRKLLREKGRVAFRIELTFAPTGGSPATQGYAGKLVKALRPAPR